MADMHPFVGGNEYLESDYFGDLRLLTPSVPAQEGRRDSIASAQSFASFSSSSTASALSPLGPATPPASATSSAGYCPWDTSVAGTPSSLGDASQTMPFVLGPSSDDHDMMGEGSSQAKWLLCQQSEPLGVPGNGEAHGIPPFYPQHSSLRIQLSLPDDEFATLCSSSAWGDSSAAMTDATVLPYWGLDQTLGSFGYDWGWPSEADVSMMEPSAVIPSSTTIVPSDVEFFSGMVKTELSERHVLDSTLMPSSPPLAQSVSSLAVETRAHYDDGSSRPRMFSGRTAALNSGLFEACATNIGHLKLESPETRLPSHAGGHRIAKALHDGPPRPKLSRKSSCRREPPRAVMRKRCKKADNLLTIAGPNDITFKVERDLTHKNGQWGKSKCQAKIVCGQLLADGTRCTAQFGKPEHRKRHRDTTHATHKLFPCALIALDKDLCKREFTRQDNRRDHYKSHLEGTHAQRPRNQTVDQEMLFAAIRRDPTENAERTISNLKLAMQREGKHRPRR